MAEIKFVIQKMEMKYKQNLDTSFANISRKRNFENSDYLLEFC